MTGTMGAIFHRTHLCPRMSAAVVAALLLSAGAAFGHGASKGMHLHVSPDPARPGEEITVVVNVSRKINRLRIGIVGQKPATVEPEAPSRRITVRLTIPAAASLPTLGIQAEGDPRHGRPLRASALVRIVSEELPPEQKGEQKP
jgi:hypothetical protein